MKNKKGTTENWEKEFNKTGKFAFIRADDNSSPYGIRRFCDDELKVFIHHLLKKQQEEERERIRKEIEERSEVERKKGWHITDIEQCRQFIDDILNLT